MDNKTSIKQNEAERKAELINQSEELVRLFGFTKGKKIGLSEIGEKLDQNRGRVKEALLLIYEQQDPKLAAELASQREVQLAFLLNIQKMVEFERTRKNGDPYYVHPESVSQKIVDYPPSDVKSVQEGVIGALLHDYLEEGDGVSPQSIAELRSAFSSFSPQMAEDLALLTEPNFIEKGKIEKPELPQAINYDKLIEKFGKNRKTFETVIFSMMLKNSKLMQMVVPVDKIDNVGDCEIIQKKKAAKDAKSPEEFNKKYLENMAKALATFLFYAENCTFPESQASRRALNEKAHQKIEQMMKVEPALADLNNAVEAKLKEYRVMVEDKEILAALKEELKNYFGSLGLKDFVSRL